MLLSLEIELTFKIVESGHTVIESATKKGVFESIACHFVAPVLFMFGFDVQRHIFQTEPTRFPNVVPSPVSFVFGAAESVSGVRIAFDELGIINVAVINYSAF